MICGLSVRCSVSFCLFAFFCLSLHLLPLSFSLLLPLLFYFPLLFWIWVFSVFCFCFRDPSFSLPDQSVSVFLSPLTYFPTLFSLPSALLHLSLLFRLPSSLHPLFHFHLPFPLFPSPSSLIPIPSSVFPSSLLPLPSSSSFLLLQFLRRRGGVTRSDENARVQFYIAFRSSFSG